jgi:UDP-glucose 4-epimerase
LTTLITGAGLIGAYVGRELQAQGEPIIFYDLAPSSEYLASILSLDGARIFSGDITNLPELASLTQRFHVDKIVHTAGLIGARVSQQPYRGIQVNVDGTIAVMEAARLNGVKRVIFCSSMAIYDFDQLPSRALISEDCPTGAKNLYGATKLACEHLLNQYGDIYNIQVVHLRLAGVYGRGQYAGGSWMGRILNRALEASIAGRQVMIKPEWIGTNEYVYAKDVARAFASACLLPHVLDGPFNIGTGLLHSFSDLVQELRALAPNAQIIIAESDTPVVSYLQRDQPFDISKAQRELGYIPQYTFRAGLQDYYDELRRFVGSYERLD